MVEIADLDDLDFDDGDRHWEQCPDCWGEGTELVCIDDICQGSGYCIHGDGEITCLTCGGWGEVEVKHMARGDSA